MLATAVLAAFSTAPAQAASQAPSAAVAKSQIVILVSDENDHALAAARVGIVQPAPQALIIGDTNFAGRFEAALAPGAYRIEVQKEGFYALRTDLITVAGAAELTLVLHHVQEFRESVEVTDSPPAVDPAKTEASRQLTNREIFSLPYPTTRDFRNVLPFLPPIVQEPSGEVHAAGAASYELLELLDGFNITHPVTGLLELRISPDSLRQIQLKTSRYSAEFGKGSGGVLQLESGMGDDHLRFLATNFIPGFEVRNGARPSSWPPRLTLSGPIRKGKAWFFEGLGAEYDFNINPDLPKGANSNPAWRIDSLSKVQWNPSPSNILTGSFLTNEGKSERVELSRFTPLESTTDQTHSDFLVSLLDSAYLGHNTLLQLGVAVAEFWFDAKPRGTLPFVLRPEGSSGNFFRTSKSRARRVQGLANLFLPPRQWRGRHEFQVGVDIDAVADQQFTERRPISILREDGTLSRLVTFTGPPRFIQDNLEVSAYVQDRWSPAEKLLIELGLRTDWDDLLRDVAVAPRLATSYLIERDPMTKLTAGVGLVYDVTNLNLITRSLAGTRFDQAFAADGVTPVGPPLVTSFSANLSTLRVPRYLNWSIGLERMLPAQLHLGLQFLEKRGNHGFTYVNQSLAGNGLYALTSTQNAHYDAVEASAHKKFSGNHEVFVAYTRSTSRSNAALDFTLDNPLFAQQAGGPLPWDAPNHLVSWGWAPLPKKIDLAYSLEWRSGFPFNVVNTAQQLVGRPDQRRFPNYFTLNLHLERRFHLKGYQWALRAGVNNVTGNKNPALVDNNIDSPRFLAFGGVQHRALTARIRFLGRKK